jgi:putative transposase
MPRAHRFYVPGLIWHITHRCHDRKFLLRFEQDQRRWRYWLFEARRRFGLCVLNYIVTSNHIHLLVKDRTRKEIPQSLQLVAGRVAQEYNQRKGRRGAFWEDRYFATAVSSDEHLIRCLVYIDLNMVRAGAVKRPSEWRVCGFNEIQNPRERYRILDLECLCRLTNSTGIGELQLRHRRWVNAAMKCAPLQRESHWTESIAVGGPEFAVRVKDKLGINTKHRQIEELLHGTHCIK